MTGELTEELSEDSRATPTIGVDGLPVVRGVTVAATSALALFGTLVCMAAAGITTYVATGALGAAEALFSGMVGMALVVAAVGRRLGCGWPEWGFRRPKRSLWHLLWQACRQQRTGHRDRAELADLRPH